MGKGDRVCTARQKAREGDRRGNARPNEQLSPGRVREWTKITNSPVSYDIKNFGRTPAILLEIYHSIELHADLPPIPRYSVGRGLPYKRILANGEETTLIECYGDFWLTNEQAQEISKGTLSLWLIGRVVYRDVVADAERITPYLYRYAGDGFEADYRAAYNQRT
jgi:hypothetical protein